MNLAAFPQHVDIYHASSNLQVCVEL